MWIRNGKNSDPGSGMKNSRLRGKINNCYRISKFLALWASQIRILPSSGKKSKKNLYFYCFVTSLWLIIFEEWCKCTPKEVISKTKKKIIFCWRPEGHWRKEQDPQRELLVRGTDPPIQVRTKMSRIRNTGCYTQRLFPTNSGPRRSYQWVTETNLHT